MPYGLTSCGDAGGLAGISGSLTLPATLTNIGGQYTFGSRNRKLTELILKGSTPPKATASNTLNGMSSMKVYVPDDAVEAYKAAQYWSTYAANIYPMSEYPAT